MSDFGERRDMGTVTTFTDPDALFTFDFEADAQTIVNESNVTVEVSWDGVNVHATLTPGVLEVVSYSDHLRPRVFVRHAGVGPAAKFVQVIAATR